ncbi:hypothetical protein SAMN05518871_10540 [Psychrobacillus sp. OK028]|uniref:hypothetical protein n=1 Tax=Psychrobacillus sp. OK028 TaxID=1884359 RepID=UPI00088587C5|nr:hypothetical protein [Psychrobacillus sp. OK028]SDN39547.1 hypothetical protein SAMN05518871_10540 [Psychrobacillus sp. OK028]
MKKNWFFAILIIISISWIANLIYFELHQLKEPVVLDSYIDIQSNEYTNFSLFYLTNRSEVVELETLIAAGYTYSNEQNFFPWFGNTTAQSYRQEFTHQYLKQAIFTFDEESLKQLVKGIQANELYARFTNGQVVPVQMEELNFEPPHNVTNVISSKASFGSNQGIQGNILEAAETVRMSAIDLPDSLLNQLELKVQLLSDTSSDSANVEKIMSKNWDDIAAPLYDDIKWPLEIQKGDSVGLIFQVKDSDSYVNIEIDWSGSTESGKAFTHTFPVLIEPNLSNQDVVDIVQKARGELR